MTSKRYPTDLTDEEWQLISGMFPTREHRETNRSYELRRIFDGCFYVLRGGISWRMMAQDREVGADQPSPARVLLDQTLYGLLLTHFAIRQLMVEASQRAGCDPDTLSFVQTIEIVRRNLPFHV